MLGIGEYIESHVKKDAWYVPVHDIKRIKLDTFLLMTTDTLASTVIRRLEEEGNVNMQAYYEEKLLKLGK